MNSAYIIYTQMLYFNKKNTSKNKQIKPTTKIWHTDNIMNELKELCDSNSWNVILINLSLTLK